MTVAARKPKEGKGVFNTRKSNAKDAVDFSGGIMAAEGGSSSTVSLPLTKQNCKTLSRPLATNVVHTASPWGKPISQTQRGTRLRFGKNGYHTHKEKRT